MKMMKRVVGFVAAVVLVACVLSQAQAQTRPNTVWRPASTSNYMSGRSGNSIRYVVIHTVEGSAQGAVSWFQNPSAQVSAHFTVDYDGTIYQSVRESDTGWHAGNSTYNRQSIGIEHAGYTARNNWTDAQYRASAAMTRYLCATYGIPRDRQHIIGHIEVPGATHTDPGPYFNWTYYMQLVNGGSAPTPPPPTPNPTPNPSPSGLKAWNVTAGSLNVRSGPSTNDTIIGSVSSGSVYVSGTESNGWARIWYDNRTGWCYEPYLSRRTGVTVRRITTDTLNVRTGPSTSNSAVGYCSSGEYFFANGTSGEWLRIYYRGAQYWIHGGYTQPSGL